MVLCSAFLFLIKKLYTRGITVAAHPKEIEEAYFANQFNNKSDLQRIQALAEHLKEYVESIQENELFYYSISSIKQDFSSYNSPAYRALPGFIAYGALYNIALSLNELVQKLKGLPDEVNGAILDRMAGIIRALAKLWSAELGITLWNPLGNILGLLNDIFGENGLLKQTQDILPQLVDVISSTNNKVLLVDLSQLFANLYVSLQCIHLFGLANTMLNAYSQDKQRKLGSLLASIENHHETLKDLLFKITLPAEERNLEENEKAEAEKEEELLPLRFEAAKEDEKENLLRERNKLDSMLKMLKEDINLIILVGFYKIELIEKQTQNIADESKKESAIALKIEESQRAIHEISQTLEGILIFKEKLSLILNTVENPVHSEDKKLKMLFDSFSTEEDFIRMLDRANASDQDSKNYLTAYAQHRSSKSSMASYTYAAISSYISGNSRTVNSDDLVPLIQRAVTQGEEEIAQHQENIEFETGNLTRYQFDLNKIGAKIKKLAENLQEEYRYFINDEKQQALIFSMCENNTSNQLQKLTDLHSRLETAISFCLNIENIQILINNMGIVHAIKLIDNIFSTLEAINNLEYVNASAILEQWNKVCNQYVLGINSPNADSVKLWAQTKSTLFAGNVLQIQRIEYDFKQITNFIAELQKEKDSAFIKTSSYYKCISEILKNHMLFVNAWKHEMLNESKIHRLHVFKTQTQEVIQNFISTSIGISKKPLEGLKQRFNDVVNGTIISNSESVKSSSGIMLAP
ncbi:MAG: hypothetical protein K0R12_176 [Gammaproteobacteria bacterium]|jgi:hypothetical protein|nr:hypothetical protein [Gammaproteobacteria bacterium]